MDSKLWFDCVVDVICSIALVVDVTEQQFKESPGLYYDHVGEARLYSSEWNVVTYINLEVVDDNFETEKLSADVCGIL
jgi:hypothetical protein